MADKYRCTQDYSTGFISSMTELQFSGCLCFFPGRVFSSTTGNENATGVALWGFQVSITVACPFPSFPCSLFLNSVGSKNRIWVTHPEFMEQGAGGSCYKPLNPPCQLLQVWVGCFLLMQKYSLLVSPVFVSKPIFPYNQGKQPVQLWGLCCSLVYSTLKKCLSFWDYGVSVHDKVAKKHSGSIVRPFSRSAGAWKSGQ